MNSIEYWNHNSAYYKWLKKETEDCDIILDVGCGDGSLLRYLDNGKQRLFGIDCDTRCIEKAVANTNSTCITYNCCSFLNFDSELKYSAIIFVASLHHMDSQAAIEKAKKLLSLRGRIYIVGLAKPSNIKDTFIEFARIIPCYIFSKIKKIESCESKDMPVSYSIPTMDEVRNMSEVLLPGYVLKYGLFYRYLLKWECS